MRRYLFLATEDGLLTLQGEKERWQAFARGLEGHKITTVAARDGVVLAGSPSGLYRSDDLGKTWQGEKEGLTIPHFRCLVYFGGGSVLAGTEPAGIFVSHNNGRSWRECPEVARLRDKHGWCLPYSPNAGCVRDFACLGARVYAAVEQGGVLRSEDGGETWNLVEGSTGNPTQKPPEAYVHPDVHLLLGHPSAPHLVYAATGDGLYRSDDGGKTWLRKYESYCRAVWSDPKDFDHVVLGPADTVESNGRIEESFDGGLSWKPASAGLETPWQNYMVERFFNMEEQLLALLSSGHIIATPWSKYSWHYILRQMPAVKALAWMKR
ncbi:MAG: hypothetical protein HY730_10265 [Candidatus Tectomicrobia bacterium]|uniref:Glycosyl hydrolase n=1 Tax=Tectimicrobiota bacterium TaxID=2528274 RepID=A0A933GNS0_UNCTE|nr:hypothetical protein [Candidatus Tectomicrobia bacterium]